MPAQQAEDMLRQLMQQLQSGQFAQNSMSQLSGAGLGASNPNQFYSTPFDESVLRQSVLGSVLGRYYGNPQMQGVGNPQSLTQGGGARVDPITGGLGTTPNWMQAGYNSKPEWKQAGRPGFNPPQGIQTGNGGNGMHTMPYFGGQQTDGNPQLLGPPQQAPTGDSFGSNKGGMTGGGVQMYGQAAPPDFSSPGQEAGGNQFFNMMQGYNPQVGALNTDYASMFNNAMTNAFETTGHNVNFEGGPTQQGGGGFNFGGQQSGFPNLDPASKASLDQITSGQMGAANVDFNKNKQDLLNNLFGRGINASSAATDAGGKLLYGRQEAMNEIQGQGAQREMQARQALLDQQTALIKARASGGGGFGGGYNAGGGMVGSDPNLTGNIAMNLAGRGGYGLLPQDQMNMVQGQLNGKSQIPLTFEQQMQLADRQLNQQQLMQQGQLGFGGLGLQQQLGMGGQGLQEQGLQQQMMQFLLGQGLQRQQGAAGMNQADLSRMTGYLGNQQNLIGGLGGQQAQIEAQRRSFLSQLLGGIAGGASSLFGAAGNAGGFGALFGGS